MGQLRRTPATVRAMSLLALGAFGVHQLRYLLAYGPETGSALARQGHSYLGSVAPVLAGLVTAALIATIVAAEFRARGVDAPRPLPIPIGALTFAAGLLAIFATQELLEGLVMPGHAAGIGALVANGGWIAGPIALVVGTLSALLMRVLESAERALGGALEPVPWPRRRAPRRTAGPRRFGGRPALATLTLAFGFARRPPPAYSSV